MPKSPKKHPSPSVMPSSPTTNRSSSPNRTSFPRRDGLGAYIASPTSFPPTRVITHSPDFVTINDLFPKSSIHLLVLPRSSSKCLLHPFVALNDDPAFLSSVQNEVRNVRVLVAKELKRRYGRFSAKENAKEEALEKGRTGSEVPEGRDWDKEVVAGIHAHPSMNHLHVHVLSRDRHSECMRHRKHYNSFATPFFIDVDDFPLEEGDRRRHPGREKYLNRELVCWRCRKGFGMKFKALQEHLELEFEAWKTE